MTKSQLVVALLAVSTLHTTAFAAGRTGTTTSTTNTTAGAASANTATSVTNEQVKSTIESLNKKGLTTYLNGPLLSNLESILKSTSSKDKALRDTIVKYSVGDSKGDTKINALQLAGLVAMKDVDFNFRAKNENVDAEVVKESCAVTFGPVAQKVEEMPEKLASGEANDAKVNAIKFMELVIEKRARGLSPEQSISEAKKELEQSINANIRDASKKYTLNLAQMNSLCK